MFLRIPLRHLACQVVVVLILGGTVHGAETEAPGRLPDPAQRAVDYVKDVRPIFEAHCQKCHGPDKQKGGWRADLKAEALTGGDNYAPNIIAGNSAESPLIHFVAGLERDMRMPEKGDPLTAEEIGTLRAWIDQGANWPGEVIKADPRDWWSLKPLKRPAVPASPFDSSNSSIPSPIDAFIHAKLVEKGLGWSPEADRRTLIRRVTFDLVGLPPSPEEVDSFVTDPDPRAYEKLVDRLLASPRYGERWARHWLDVVRYGETHGYDKDKQRNHAWPYRDYVIRAFNEDKPYARFVQEQIAGDILFPHSRDGIEALGFISAGPWDFIGHTEVPESKTDGKIARNLDRDDMVGNAMNTFTSLTVQCARCHDHKVEKFITQKHYYGLQAVFAALDRTDRKYDLDPEVSQRRQELEARQRELTEEREKLLRTAREAAAAPLKELEERINALKRNQSANVVYPEAHGYHSQISETQEAVRWVQLDLGKPSPLGKVVLRPCFDDFNSIGEGFGFPVRFKVEISDDADFANGVTVIGDHTAADFANPRLNVVEFPANGRSARFIRVTATKLAPRKRDYIFALAEVGALDTEDNNLAKGATVTALDSIEAPPRWRKANLVDGEYPSAGLLSERNDFARLEAEREAIINAAFNPHERASFSQVGTALAVVEREIAQLPKQHLVYAGTIHHGSGAFLGTGPNGGKPRTIHVLHRGEVNSPRNEAAPGTVPVSADAPATFSLAPDAPEGERRAALARWITDPHNPLTWRSIVNRVWQYHFGRGIVDSPNDFGRMGQLPTHPELLDWLAIEFRDGGQSFKELHRLIVTSATYRQASAIQSPVPGQLQQGPTAWDRAHAADLENRYLWRMNRRRLEAEAVRDSVLSISGKLDLTMGGPSFQDFVIEQPEHSPHYKYGLHDPEDIKSHRRSIYRFIVRSQPQPFLTTLDCADPSMSVEKRNESMSALQALALLNNQLMVAMAMHFAARVQEDTSAADKQIIRAYQLATGREPRPEEQRSLTDYARQQGLANACRVIFNLNEFFFVD